SRTNIAMTWNRVRLVGPSLPRDARASTSRTRRARSGMRGAASVRRREDTVVEPFFGTETPETKGVPLRRELSTLRGGLRREHRRIARMHPRPGIPGPIAMWWAILGSNQ